MAEEAAVGLDDVEVGGVGMEGFLDSGEVGVWGEGGVVGLHDFANLAALEEEDFAASVDVVAGGLDLEEEEGAGKEAVGDEVADDDGNHDGGGDGVVLVELEDDEDGGDGGTDD